MNNHSEDYLKREEFLIFLENVVKYSIKYHNENTESKAIGIDGEWGSGKTWILEEFAKRNNSEYLIFHYNAWNNDYYNEPLVGILASMIETLNSSRNIELLMIKYKNILKQEVIDELKQIVNDILSSIEIKGVPLGKIFRFFKRLNDKSKIGFKDNLKHISVAINKISKVLDKISVPIIIMVDELDRCLPEYAIKVLERLHHIGNATKIIQLIAINKNTLNYGIAKVYGRFDLLNKNDQGKISDFGFMYLKKLFNMFLPLPNGLIESSKSNLLFDNTFLSQVKEYKIDNPLSPNIKINISKEYFLGFYSKLFENINIRDQMKIIDLVQVCHNISKETALSGGYNLENFEYQHLIWEILVCVDLLVTKKLPFNNWFKIYKEAENKNLCFYFFNDGSSGVDVNFLLPSDANFKMNIKFNLFSFFCANNQIKVNINENGFQVYDNKSFILSYYGLIWPLDIMYDATGIMYEKIVNKIIREQKFLQEFQKNMKMLIN